MDIFWNIYTFKELSDWTLNIKIDTLKLVYPWHWGSGWTIPMELRGWQWDEWEKGFWWQTTRCSFTCLDEITPRSFASQPGSPDHGSKGSIHGLHPFQSAKWSQCEFGTCAAALPVCDWKRFSEERTLYFQIWVHSQPLLSLELSFVRLLPRQRKMEPYGGSLGEWWTIWAIYVGSLSYRDVQR